MEPMLQKEPISSVAKHPSVPAFALAFALAPPKDTMLKVKKRGRKPKPKNKVLSPGMTIEHREIVVDFS